MDTTHTKPPFLAWASRASVHFPILTRRTPGPTPPSAQQSPGLLPRGKNRPVRGTAYRHTESRIRKCGDMPSLLLTSYGMMVLMQAQE